ncbi:hypothetical protein T09_4312 [Trichinella sp. T9]|nr:hypothetical protein T09_4312 [Trichinella sp. T9]
METKYVFCFVLVKRHLSLAQEPRSSSRTASKWSADGRQYTTKPL